MTILKSVDKINKLRRANKNAIKKDKIAAKKLDKFWSDVDKRKKSLIDTYNRGDK